MVFDLCGACVAPDDDSCIPPSVMVDIQNVDLNAGTLDIYMENIVDVGGFQFELSGINVLSATAPDGYIVNTSSTSTL